MASLLFPQERRLPGLNQFRYREQSLDRCSASGRSLAATAPRKALLPRQIRHSRALRRCTSCASHNGQNSQTATMPAPRSPFQTGTSEPSFQGSTQRLTLRDEPLTAEKFIVVVRHGLTTWNESKRIQGDSDMATLTPFGEEQAKCVRHALSHKHFDSCFASPIQRAYKFAQIIWGDRDGPLIPYERLKEANLGWLQGMTNADAAKDHPEAFQLWRERPADFWIDGHLNPLNEVFERAKEVWADVLAAEGSSHLLVTHKSIMRAMMCVALGLPTSSFRAVEINNGGVSIFRINKKGEPMLVNLNMTAHMHAKDVVY